jgi:hypothetical protein
MASGAKEVRYDAALALVQGATRLEEDLHSAGLAQIKL